MASDEKSSQGKRTAQVPETIEYGGVQCRVRHHDPEKPYIVTIRHPGPPAQEFEIVYPFGEPGKTLFIDGQAFKVREISVFSSNLTANQSPPPDPAGQSRPMKADPAVLEKYDNAVSDEPQWRSLQKCIVIKIELPDGGFSEVHVHTSEDDCRHPIGIASKVDAIRPVPAGGLKSLYDEVLLESVIDCNAKVLFAERFQAVDCFVVTEPLIAIADLPSKAHPMADDTERTSGTRPTADDSAAKAQRISEIRRENGKMHGTFYDKDPKVRERDQAVIKERFDSYRQKQGMSKSAAAQEVARLLSKDAMESPKERSIKTKGSYENAKKDAVLRLVGMKI